MIEGIEVEAPHPQPPITRTMEKNGRSKNSGDDDHNQVVVANEDHGVGDDKEPLWKRQAKSVARNPCRYLLVSLVASVLLSVIGMTVGEFSVGADTGGWQSRGTEIADRTAQILITEINQDYLFTGGEDAWEDLITNHQPGWDGDDDDESSSSSDGNNDKDGNRRLQLLESSAVGDWKSTMPQPPSVSASVSTSTTPRRTLPFTMTDSLKRALQDQGAELMPGCDFDWYNSEQMTNSSRLWPIWKVQHSKSALDPSVLHDVCVTEQNTQRVLEEKGYCFGCDEGCLPPMSIVLYARLVLSTDASADASATSPMAMSCAELQDAWGPYQAKTKEQWTDCVADIDTEYDPETKTLPGSCPDHFSTAMLNHNFDETGVVSFTSSIFATLHDDDTIEDMFDDVGKFDKGSGSIDGVYDTQDEDFGNLYSNNALSSDMALAMASAVVVAIAILVHTRSPFITLIGLVQIMLSFPLAFFVYSLVLGLEFFPFLNFLGMFVIFGLGADDVFVAMDKWKNARMDSPLASTEHIASIALPDAASAMFLTTITTAIAFFATAICPVAPIKMFAIFCGLLVLLDYVMNVLLVFPALCIYDRALEKHGDHVNCCVRCRLPSWCCRRSTDGGDDDDDDNDGNNHDDANRNKRSSNNTTDGHHHHDHDHDHAAAASNDDDENNTLIRRILLKLFQVLHRGRWPLFVLSMASLGLTAGFASSLELPTSSDVRVLADDVEYEQNYIRRKELLFDQLERSEGSTAYVIWGVKADDTGDLDNPDKWSQLVLDDSFDPSSEAAQTYFLDFCSDLFEEDFATPISSNYTCSFKEFHEWLGDQASLSAASSSSSSSSSVSATYAERCDGATGLPMASDKFHSCMSGWTHNEAKDKTVLPREDRVTIVMIPFSSRVRYDDNYDKLDDEWNLIEDWMKEQNKDEAPEGVNRAFFSSVDFWWYDTNGQMLKTAYGSAGIALAAATIMLLLTSRSLVLTLFSTMTVAYVLCSVTATLVSLGWTLGFLESICFSILIGISCDFVLHFAHAYASIQGDVSRKVRSQFALIHMGPSILAAAFTTIASAAVMNFTVITFFQKFGLILLITVVQATLGSFIVFITLVLCFGPKNPTKLCDSLVSKLKKGRRDDGDNGGTDGSKNKQRSGRNSDSDDDDDDEESNLGHTSTSRTTVAHVH